VVDRPELDLTGGRERLRGFYIKNERQIIERVAAALAAAVAKAKSEENQRCIDAVKKATEHSCPKLIPELCTDICLTCTLIHYVLKSLTD